LNSIKIETPVPSEEVVDLSENLNDDRNFISIDDKTILIIEDDASFAEVLLQVARDNGFKAIVAYQGETGYKYAKKYKESDYFRYYRELMADCFKLKRGQRIATHSC
jgi:hypothetical protein